MTDNSEKSYTPTEEEFDFFKNQASQLIKLDLNLYKPKQMNRRILTFMERFEIKTLEDFYNQLINDKFLFNKFINMVTINVSEFFRDKKHFNEFENIYREYILKKGIQTPKIWSAGCSTGAEIFSVAIILDNNNLLDSVQLIGTDCDENVLNKARSGIFTESEMETVPEEFQNYFEKISPNSYQLSQKIVKKVDFIEHDLLKDFFDSNFNFIICRNVVIYLTTKAKDDLYDKFYNCLTDDGILFVGSTERILNSTEIGFKSVSGLYYKKINKT